MAVHKDKLRQKLHHIRESVEHLEEIRGRGRDAFVREWLLRAAAERSLQVAIEAVLDVANHLIAQEGWGLPNSYREALEILLREEVLPQDKAQNYLRMVSFRNRIVHLTRLILKRFLLSSKIIWETWKHLSAPLLGVI